jgi:DNA-binding NarL/FixJ family response regulator
MSNKEIAQALYLQPQTVKNYVHQVLQKLNLRNRLELIRSQRAAR